MSRLFLTGLLAAACTGMPDRPGPVDTPVDDTDVDPSGDPWSEHAGIDHVEPPPPPPREDDWTEPAEEDGDEPVLSRQLLVQVADGVDLGRLARRHGTQAILAADADGLASVAVPEDVTANDLLHELTADPDVLSAARMGLVVGAADGWAVAHQWHHDAMSRVTEVPAGLSKLTVAVLDTGVAFEDYVDPDGQAYVAAPSLATTEFVAPWDFVNDDKHPNDDHQHGTHIASVIASQGDVVGVAPGVRIMPVKVLDHRKRGTELDLIRGIDHAVENGADVVNLSLSFPIGYLPSPALRRSLETAREAGVVLVAAAGNAGAGEVTWPAASPHVIAVGASDFGGAVAPYSNTSGELDVLAPGGDLTADTNEDGLPDGILGETIAPDDPTRTGLWFVEGTSQATALVSGLAALRLTVDPDPEAIVGVLQKETTGGFAVDEWRGSGVVNAEATMVAREFRPHIFRYATVRPFLVHKGDLVRPGASVRIVDENGRVVPEVEVYGRVSGSMDATWQCTTSAEGVCAGLSDTMVADPSTEALAFAITADGIWDRHRHVDRLRKATVATDALNVLTAAMDRGDDTRDAALLFLDHAGMDDALGHSLAESYVFLDLGSGLLSSPMGVVATRSAVDPWLTRRSVGLDVDGTGLLSSPMGAQTITLATLLAPTPKEVEVDGTGLLSSPMLGFSSRFAVLGSSGPLGFDATALMEPGHAPRVDVKESVYTDELLLLEAGTVLGSSASGSALLDRVHDGAWHQGSFGGASAFVGSGRIAAPLEGSATTAEAVELAR